MGERSFEDELREKNSDKARKKKYREKLRKKRKVECRQ